MRRTKKPSNAVTHGTVWGTLAGALIEAGAAAVGIPLPPGTGAMLGGALVGAIAYKARGGRQGEPD